MWVLTSLKSSLKVALLRLIPSPARSAEHCPDLVSMLLKFTCLCIIAGFLLTNAAAISAVTFSLYISFYWGNTYLLLYAYNTCGNGGIFSLLWNKPIFLPLPSPRPQTSKPYPFTSLCTLTQPGARPDLYQQPRNDDGLAGGLGGSGASEGTSWVPGGSGSSRCWPGSRAGGAPGQGLQGQGRTRSAPTATMARFLHVNRRRKC